MFILFHCRFADGLKHFSCELRLAGCAIDLQWLCGDWCRICMWLNALLMLVWVAGSWISSFLRALTPSLHLCGLCVMPADTWLSLLYSAVCLCIFDRYNKSVAQLMIRWSVQKGYVTIPKSSQPERLLHNSQVFDWTLSPQDIEILVCVIQFYFENW